MRGDLRQARAGLGQGMAGQGASTSACATRADGPPEVRAARRPAVRERRHPHRPRGQQDPEGHDRQGAPARGFDAPTCRAGTATACRSRCRSKRSTARTCRAPKCRRSAAPTPPSRSSSRRPTSSASACSATGTIRTARWTSRNEADEIRALGACSSSGFVYRGLKPVNWCFDCGSALAEAEVEYEDKKSTDDRRRLPSPSRTSSRRRSASTTLPTDDGLRVIWTTTPWTHPANQALNVQSGARSTRWSTPTRGLLILASALVEACLERYGLDGHGRSRPRTGEALDGLRLPPSARRRRSGLRPRVAGLPRRLRDAEDGTGIVHSSPAYGVDDFNSCRAHGMTDDDILNPVQGDGRYAPIAAALRRPEHLEGEPADRRRAARSAARCSHTEKHHAQLHALLAPQDAGHLPRDDAVVRRHGRRAGLHTAQAAEDAARRPRCDGIEATQLLSRRGARRACTA